MPLEITAPDSGWGANTREALQMIGLKGALNIEDRRESPVNLGDLDLSWGLSVK